MVAARNVALPRARVGHPQLRFKREKARQLTATATMLSQVMLALERTRGFAHYDNLDTFMTSDMGDLFQEKLMDLHSICWTTRSRIRRSVNTSGQNILKNQRRRNMFRMRNVRARQRQVAALALAQQANLAPPAPPMLALQNGALALENGDNGDEQVSLPIAEN